MNDKGTIVQQLEDEVGHLKKQLAAVKEAGEPFCLFYKTNMTDMAGNCELVWRHNGSRLTVTQFGRLVQALKEVKG